MRRVGQGPQWAVMYIYNSNSEIMLFVTFYIMKHLPGVPVFAGFCGKKQTNNFQGNFIFRLFKRLTIFQVSYEYFVRKTVFLLRKNIR